MTEELENIYAAMLEAARRGDVKGAEAHADGMKESEKIELLAYATHWIRVHEVLRERLIVHTDTHSLHADRKAMARACEIPPSTLYRWLDRLGLPRNRREQR
jgi:DNA-binding NtrC family response regulator